MAHIFRAILFANAIATSIRGFLASIRESQLSTRGGLRLSQFKRAMTPVTSSLRMSAWPAFDIRPRRSLPPEENCFGTSPSHAQHVEDDGSRADTLIKRLLAGGLEGGGTVARHAPKNDEHLLIASIDDKFKLVGDVAFAECKTDTDTISLVPSVVGPMMIIAALMASTVIAAIAGRACRH